jgi:hypothetical protein
MPADWPGSLTDVKHQNGKNDQRRKLRKTINLETLSNKGGALVLGNSIGKEKTFILSNEDSDRVIAWVRLLYLKYSEGNNC